MNLSDISAYRFIDSDNRCLDQNGFEVGKPSIWYLAGRTILWFLTFGYFKVNPSLDEGTKKVIVATRSIFSDTKSLKEIDDAQSYDFLKDALMNLKKIQVLNGGSNSINAELDQLIQIVDVIKTASIVFSDSNTRVNRAYGFLDDIRNGRIDSREEFLQKVGIFYPEIEMYKGVTKGSAEFASAEMERQRTETSLLFIYWLWKHDESALTEKDDQAYQDFIRGQSGKVLRWESFKELSAEFKAEYNTLEKLNFLIATMGLHDLGKVEFIKKLAQKETKSIDPHDEILLYIFKNHPELFASFMNLSAHRQQSLINAWEMDYLGPQFMQGENVPASLTKVLNCMQTNPEDAEHFQRHDLSDLAGVMGFGQINPVTNKFDKGCMSLNEDTYQSWKKTREELRTAKDEKEAYKQYLAYRAALLHRSDKPDVVIPEDQRLTLDVNKAEDYAFMRICCMARLFYHENVSELKDAFALFKDTYKGEFSNLVAELNCSGLDGKKAILIYYAPAIMVNIAKYQFVNGAKKVDVMVEGLRILSEIFQATREHLDGEEKGNGVFVVDAGQISKTFAVQPHVLTLDAVRQCLENSDNIVFDVDAKSVKIVI